MSAEIGNIIGSGALGGASVYLVTSLHLVRNLNPLAKTLSPANGLVFGVVGRLITEVTNSIFERIRHFVDYGNGAPQACHLFSFARFTGTVALTAIACTALGIPMSFTTALVLQVSQRAFAHLIDFVGIKLGTGRPFPISFVPIISEDLAMYRICGS